METENTTPTPEELQVEQESLADIKDNDLRSSVIDYLGLEDNADNAAMIDKLVERERQSRQKLSSAIGAKIKYREQAQSFLTKGTDTNKTKVELDADAIRRQTEETVKAQFDEEYLEESDFSDNLKAELRKVAKINGTTVRGAVKDSYIQHLIEKESTERKIAEAAKNGGGGQKGTDTPGVMPDRFNDPSYMASPAGQKDYDDWYSSKK